MLDRDYRRQLREERREARHSRRGSGNAVVGLIVIVIGALLLLREFGIWFPSWFFTWPMILIAVGLAIGIKNKFRDLSWLVLIAVGALFIADDIVPDFSIRPFIWPIAIIGFGLLMITRGRSKGHGWGSCQNNVQDIPPSPTSFTPMPETEVPPTSAYTSQVPVDDAIDIVSIFSGIKRTVYSKNFRGGEVVCVFGGADINLIQADIQGPVIIEVVQLFGGAKLIVPSNWTVRTEAVPVFGSVEDKRPSNPMPGDKVLIIRGTVIFGGVEIKSY